VAEPERTRQKERALKAVTSSNTTSKKSVPKFLERK